MVAGMKATTHREPATGPIEAYGVKGLKSTAWRKTFKSEAALTAWADKHDAKVHGCRTTLTELEPEEAAARVADGTIRETERGEENTYYRAATGREFYSKNYPITEILYPEHD